MIDPKLMPETTDVVRKPMSYEAYLAYADETRLVEWVNGVVIEYLPHSLSHQNVVVFLVTLMQAFAKVMNIGNVFVAPLEVKLWSNGPSREPDLFFVSTENEKNMTEKRFEGAPDLVVEVISPSSVTMDRVDKFLEYEKAGVREYWLLDVRPRQRKADFYVRNEAGKFEAVPIGEDGVFKSVVLPHFWLDIDWVWPDMEMNPQTALAKIIVGADGIDEKLREAYRPLAEL